MADIGISTSVNSCLRLFKLLLSLDASVSEVTPNKTILDSLREEEARFRVWVGNIGAHKTGRSSLEYRLRDASHIQKQVIELISDLTSSLENARAILSGEKTPWDILEDDDDNDSILDEPGSESDSVDADSPRTELDQIVLIVADVVNCLLRLSVAIRNPAPHDRFASSIRAIDADHYEPFDIQHVQGKFGQVNESLAMRLGKAISRRRQYFKYRERHHQKLSEGISAQELIPSNMSKDTASTIASSIPIEIKGVAFDLSRLATVDEDALSDSGFSQTSYASSVAESDTLKIPPMPKEAHNGPFECPFCFMMVTASTTISWRRHVFGDLRPYICLAEHCADAGREFARRHEWTTHEMQNHWKKYVCPAGCSKEFSLISRCKEHLGEAHPHSIPPNQVDALVGLSTRPLGAEDGIQCPLCQDQLSSFKQYQRHVGRHQEQLALFALPHLDLTDEADGDEHGGDSSEDGEPSDEESDTSDKIVEAEDLEPNAEPGSENTGVLDKAVLDSVDDESFMETLSEPLATELGFPPQEVADRLQGQLLLEKIEASKDENYDKVKSYTPLECIEPGCKQWRCTPEDSNDPKDSLYCQEHVCRVSSCVRFRVSTLDLRGPVPIKRFETKCSEHWVNPDEARWESLTSTRDRGIGIPADRVTFETDPKGKGKENAHQDVSEMGGVTPGQDSAQNFSGISGLGFPSLETLRQTKANTDWYLETLGRRISQRNKIDQIKALAMAERMNQELKETESPISQMSLRDDPGFRHARELGGISAKEPNQPIDGEAIAADLPAQRDGFIDQLNAPRTEDEDLGFTASFGDEAVEVPTKDKADVSTRVPADDTWKVSAEGQSLPTWRFVTTRSKDYAGTPVTSTKGARTLRSGSEQESTGKSSSGRANKSERERERGPHSDTTVKLESSSKLSHEDLEMKRMVLRSLEDGMRYMEALPRIEDELREEVRRTMSEWAVEKENVQREIRELEELHRGNG